MEINGHDGKPFAIIQSVQLSVAFILTATSSKCSFCIHVIKHKSGLNVMFKVRFDKKNIKSNFGALHYTLLLPKTIYLDN